MFGVFFWPTWYLLESMLDASFGRSYLRGSYRVGYIIHITRRVEADLTLSALSMSVLVIKLLKTSTVSFTC